MVKILVVEDDPDISDLLKRVLESDGYEVEMATDSAGALRAVAEGEPDLVLLDVVLGGEDGRDLLVKLRQLLALVYHVVDVHVELFHDSKIGRAHV